MTSAAPIPVTPINDELIQSVLDRFRADPGGGEYAPELSAAEALAGEANELVEDVRANNAALWTSDADRAAMRDRAAAHAYASLRLLWSLR